MLKISFKGFFGTNDGPEFWSDILFKKNGHIEIWVPKIHRIEWEKNLPSFGHTMGEGGWCDLIIPGQPHNSIIITPSERVKWRVTTSMSQSEMFIFEGHIQTAGGKVMFQGNTDELLKKLPECFGPVWFGDGYGGGVTFTIPDGQWIKCSPE